MHGVDHQTARLDGRPHPPLVIHSLHRHQAQGEHELRPHQLPVVRLGLRRPREKRGDILSHLRLRRGGVVVVLHAAVDEHLGHGDRTAREVRVVVKALADAHARGGLAVPEEERKYVVLAVVSRLGDERKIGRVRAVVGVPRALLVGVGRGEPVAELAGAIEHLAGVVRAVGHLRRGGKGGGNSILGFPRGDIFGSLCVVHGSQTRKNTGLEMIGTRTARRDRARRARARRTPSRGFRGI